ncbi:MAG: UTP--glucose-1-phosphate uridylyltransferase [Desulfobacterales bacterium]|jgi:UTP--glucose-1-phosphate uridylyltransferase
MAYCNRYPYLPVFEKKMTDHGIPPFVIDTFAGYYRMVVDGATGIISDDSIRPLNSEEIVDAGRLSGFADTGRDARRQAARITLNGGLGTSMGLTGPKSLLAVKEGRTFLDVILSQSRTDSVRQVFMNSFSTDADTREALSKANLAAMPILFMQNKYPKILQGGFAPAQWPEDPSKEWNPPGHGDIYTALHTTGTLEALRAEGIRYAFIHNSDNLGATVDDALLGFFVDRGLAFMMEVAQREPVDFKGGHLAVRKGDGRIILRESAQCPPNTQGADVTAYRYFNTNNLWVDLYHLKSLLDREGSFTLPLIVNPKTLDPRDPDSPAVFQVETAMGSAIERFENARAVCVTRNRFFPVKKCNDLLVIRSDRYRFSTDHRLRSENTHGLPPPCIDLDSDYYGRIDDFDARFGSGIPSLKGCRSLTIRGDIRFESGVSVIGSVTLANRQPKQVVIPEGTVIDRDREWT